MTRRVISSGTGSDGSATTPENQTSHGRTIQSRKHSDAGKQVQPKGRSVAGGAGRASSSGKKTQENTVESGNKGSVSRSRSGDFVDARNLAGEDFVSKTLEETTGTLGVVTRPKVVDFSAPLLSLLLRARWYGCFSSHRYSVSSPAILALSAPTNG